ncbi:MAG: oxidoreductase [Candidatus Bathyarchaeia archaeon]
MSERKVKFAFYWAASCGGCEIAVLDIDEKILDVINVADIVFWPVAMDIKYRDVEGMPDKYIDVCFFNGGIRNSEQEHMAKLLRQKSKILVAYGSCAHLGGIPGLANLHNKEEIFRKVYFETFSTVNPENLTPKPRVRVKEGELEIPEFYDTVHTLNQVVDVDYYVPGCPPAIERTVYALETIANGMIKGELPPRGSVLAPLKSVCDECIKKKESKKISHIYRVYEKVVDPERCLLEQGVICMGPATRGGCGARCLKADMPCTGCGGPCPESPEQGAAMISALASILGVEEEKEKYTVEEVEKIVDQIVDPVGTFYMYALPASILKRRVMRK